MGFLAALAHEVSTTAIHACGVLVQEPHPQLLVMGAGLMCSGAMGLPVSGFPNMNAVALEDQTGQAYLTTADFLKVGIAGAACFPSRHHPMSWHRRCCVPSRHSLACWRSCCCHP